MFHKFLKRLLLVFTICFIPLAGQAQRNGKDRQKRVEQKAPFTTPKLVVGIVVDQMRYDYLTRFWNHYEEGGFKRMIEEGFNCKDNHVNYVPVGTGPGHTSIYTGTTPATHGIIGDYWYDKISKKEVYCVADDAYNPVGTTSDDGKMSPHRMEVTTLADQLRLHTQFRGKTVAIAIRDRGAVLPGGQTANAAYWFAGNDEGKWITSSFYMPSLPKWVDDFNVSGKIQNYKKPWTPLKAVNTYLESGPDNNPNEGLFETETTPTFPHSTPKMLNKQADFEILKYTPYGNSMTTDFALAALEGENLGTDGITDFLAISYSSTDYVGNKFGVNSKETQDTYLRLDRDLERLFTALDKKVGVGEYTVFLTADHAAIQAPSNSRNQKISTSYFEPLEIATQLREFVRFKYGSTDFIENVSNNQLFLNEDAINNLELNAKEVQENLAGELLKIEGIAQAYTAYQMRDGNYERGIPYMLQNGYNQKRSGDVFFVLKPGLIDYPSTGSTHGSSQIYDTHVPLLFYGKGIRRGATTERTEISDIAPTIAVLLGIAYPNGTTGKPIAQALK